MNKIQKQPLLHQVLVPKEMKTSDVAIVESAANVSIVESSELRHVFDDGKK